MKLKNHRILVVEDEALVAMLVEDALLDEGATILGPAATVYDALRLVDEAQVDGAIDAAVLDLNLGGETALAVADKLATLGVPFLISSGYGDACDRGRHLGAPVLPKPYDPSKLVTSIGALCRERRAAYEHPMRLA